MLSTLSALGVAPSTLRRSTAPVHRSTQLVPQRVAAGDCNWTRSAANHNEENIVVTGDRRLKKAFEGEFARLWKAFGAPY